MGCAPPELAQTSQAIQAAPFVAPIRPAPSAARRADRPQFAVVTEPIPAAPPAVQPEPGETHRCGPRADQLDSLRDSLRAQWVIVRGTVASTPVIARRTLEGGGNYGFGQQIERSTFEFRVLASSAPDAVPVNTRVWVSHNSRVFSITEQGAVEQTRVDELDGRTRRAPVAAERDMLLVLTQDVLNRSGKLLVASVLVENGRLSEAALSHQVGTSVDQLFADVATTQRQVDAEGQR